MIRVFIGYDSREAVAYHVCANRINRQAKRPVAITPLALHNQHEYRETHADGINQFIYSRFLLPHLTDYTGCALFVDGDMVVRDDISQLWDLRDESKAVMSVQNDYKAKAHGKHLGSKNQDYPRKNWSSVLLWNCGHPANHVVTQAFVEAGTGAQLHRFTWLTDDLVGALPKVWNWLPQELGANPDAKLLHWTLGTLCFHEYADDSMVAEWHRERLLADYSPLRRYRSRTDQSGHWQRCRAGTRMRTHTRERLTAHR